MCFVFYDCVSEMPAQAVLHLLRRETSMYYLFFPVHSNVGLINALWFIQLSD